MTWEPSPELRAEQDAAYSALRELEERLQNPAFPDPGKEERLEVNDRVRRIEARIEFSRPPSNPALHQVWGIGTREDAKRLRITEAFDHAVDEAFLHSLDRAGGDV
jgi:hypothetical protein